MPGQTGSSPTEITALLVRWRSGEVDALDRLIPLVYRELQAIARRQLARERPDHTLSTSGLVHEAYLELLQQSAVEWQDRVHFYAIASRTMRRILVWHARKRNAAKRSGGPMLTLDEATALTPGSGVVDDLLVLNDALERLEQVDPRLCRVVECRHFGGLSVEETATALDISPATVKRDWQAARAWLRVALEGEPA